MMRRRNLEMAVGIALALAIPLIGFLTTADKNQAQPITGYAIYEQVIDGPEFTAVIAQREYVYRFMDNKWFEFGSEGWQYRIDMGTTLASGLLYLESYGAEIYKNGERMTADAYFTTEVGG